MGADNTFGETNFNPDSGTIKASDAYQTTITERHALYKSQVAWATNREAAWFWQKAKVIAQDEKFTVLEVWSPFGSPTILTIPTEEIYFLE